MDKNDRGFTLMELVIVVAIMGILALIATPNLIGIRNRAQINSDIRTSEQIGQAVRIWATDSDAALGEERERTIPTGKAIWYADDYFVSNKFTGMGYYVGLGYVAKSLQIGDGTYFIYTFEQEPSVQKIVVGIDEKAEDLDAEGYRVAKTLSADLPSTREEVLNGGDWYLDGTAPGWAYLEK